MKDPITLRLGYEELVFLLFALQCDTAIGLPAHPFAHLDADHQNLALATVDRSLRARGVIAWKTATEREMDPVVTGILERYTRPDSVFTINIHRVGIAVTYHIALSQQFFIEHAEVAPGVHQFFTLNNTDDAWERISQILPLRDTLAGSGEACILTTTAYSALEPSAPELEIAAFFPNLSPPLIQQVTNMLGLPLITQDLQLQASDTAALTAFTLYHSERGLFCLESPSAQTLAITPISGALAHTKIEQLLQNWLTNAAALTTNENP